MRWTESKLRLEDVVFFFYFKHRKKCEKMILKGIRGVSSLGELLAILGPSGRGKTTLPTTLGGRLSTGETRGNIDYNNNPLSRTVKRKTGFVAPSNVFYLHLTVTETLVFIALFRLPNCFTNQRKMLQAEAVTNQLGMTRCRGTIVREGFRTWISGGELRRELVEHKSYWSILVSCFWMNPLQVLTPPLLSKFCWYRGVRLKVDAQFWWLFISLSVAYFTYLTKVLLLSELRR